jgi:hypothetical protein
MDALLQQLVALVDSINAGLKPVVLCKDTSQPDKAGRRFAVEGEWGATGARPRAGREPGLAVYNPPLFADTPHALTGRLSPPDSFIIVGGLGLAAEGSVLRRPHLTHTTPSDAHVPPASPHASDAANALAAYPTPAPGAATPPFERNASNSAAAASSELSGGGVTRRRRRPRKLSTAVSSSGVEESAMHYENIRYTLEADPESIQQVSSCVHALVLIHFALVFSSYFSPSLCSLNLSIRSS